MRVLLDTNIVLDYLLEREPFLQDTEALFDAIDSGQVVGYVTATTLTDIFYIARRQTRNADAGEASRFNHAGYYGHLLCEPGCFRISFRI